MANTNEQNETVELKKGKSYVTVVGKAKINEKTFSGELTSDRTGYVYSRINLGIEVEEGVTVYGEMMGGYAPSNPVIYSMNKEDNSPTTVNFADRLNQNIVDSTADFKLHKVGLLRDDKGDLIVEKFLSPMDVHDYLQEHLKDGMEVTVKGSFGFSEYKDDTQRKFQIQNIFLPYQKEEVDESGNKTGELLPVQTHASFVQSVLVTEDTFKKLSKADKDAGEIVLPTYAVDYVGKKNGKPVKKNMPFPLPITVKINQEDPSVTEKILKALFDVKKGVVRELAIEGSILEGYEKQEVSEKDVVISDEIKELIAMGLYSEEEAKQKMTVRGNKVSKLIFARPFLQKDKDDPTKIFIDKHDDKYTPEHLIVELPEEEEKSTDNTLEQLADEGSPANGDDNAWMSALGV